MVAKGKGRAREGWVLPFSVKWCHFTKSYVEELFSDTVSPLFLVRIMYIYIIDIDSHKVLI